MIKACHLSRLAKKVCKSKHFTPRFFEPLNNNKNVYDFDPYSDDDFKILRIWNSKREIYVTAFDIWQAEQGLL